MEKLATYIVREGALCPSDAVGWAVRLTIALEVLHGAGVAHGRISARAIQVLGPSSRAAGFFLDTGELLDDPAYHCPERLAGGAESSEDDCWAVGVLLYYGLTGQLPFAGDTAAEILDDWQTTGATALGVFGIRRPGLQQILNHLFSRQRNRRLTSVAELRKLLVRCEPDAASLRALHLGKPDLEIFDDDSDEEGEKLTAVMDRGDWDKHVQAALRMRLAKDGGGSASPPESAPPSDEAEISVKPASGDVLGLSWDDLPESPGYGIDRTALEGGRDSSRAQPSQSPSDSGGSEAVALSDSQDRSSIGGSASRLRPAHYLFVLLMVAVGGVAALLVYRPDLLAALTGAEPSVKPAASGSGTSTAPPALSTATGTSSAAASAAGSASAASSAASAAPSAASAAPATSAAPTSAAPGEDPTACMLPLFHRGTYGRNKPRLRFVCTQKDARLGGADLRRAVVAGIRRTSSKPAMREWNQLGWYELAVFATLRAKCCAAAPPLETATSFEICRLDRALTELGKAAISGNEDVVAKAVDDYQGAVTCLVRKGAARGFKQPSARPKDSAVATFLKMVERLSAEPK